MFYEYDADSRLSFLIHVDLQTGVKSYYSVVTNSQGDVIKLLGGTGVVRATYTYDAWGNAAISTTNALSKTIANANSIRYRGYVYDTETGLYYLQSRYYDPQTGRFISSDQPEYIGANDDVLGWNSFSYCENEPVLHIDKTGNTTVIISMRFIYDYVYVYLYNYSITGHIDFSIKGQIYSYGSNGASVISKIRKNACGYISKNSVANWHKNMSVKSTVKLGLTKNEYITLVSSLTVFMVTCVSNKNIGKKTTKIYQVIRGKYSTYTFQNSNCATFVGDFIFGCAPDLFGNINNKRYFTPSSVFNAIKSKGDVVK